MSPEITGENYLEKVSACNISQQIFCSSLIAYLNQQPPDRDRQNINKFQHKTKLARKQFGRMSKRQPLKGDDPI